MNDHTKFTGKKKYLFLLLFLTLAISISGAYAFTLNLAQGMTQVIQWITDFFGTLFTALLGGNGDFLFERIMLFIIILAFTKTVLSEVPAFKDKNKAAVWIISIVVSLLAARLGFATEYLRTIFLPYTALGIVISAVVPFVIYFYFVGSFKNRTLRKILWIFFAVVFMALWLSRSDEVGGLSWIYFWAAVIALIFFFFDGTIRRAIIRGEYAELGRAAKDQQLINVRSDLYQLEQRYGQNLVTDAEYKRMKKRIEERMRILQE